MSDAPNQKLLRYLTAMDTNVYVKRQAATVPAATSTKRKAATVPATTGTKRKAATVPAATSTKRQAVTVHTTTSTKRKAVTVHTATGTKRQAVTVPAATSSKSQAVTVPAATGTPVPDPAHPVAKAGGQMTAWEPLLEKMNGCRDCKLHSTRTNVVPGVGNRDATWMIVGEAPGSEEDRRGEPFVGRAGQLLDKMLKAIGLDRENVYITNTVKCRPPQNRNPEDDELQACHGHLLRQVQLVSPRILLALGKVAANVLLTYDGPLKGLRGTVHTFEDTGIPVVVTYHPAYLLRQPGQKRGAWEDLQLAVRVLADAAQNQDEADKRHS